MSDAAKVAVVVGISSWLLLCLLTGCGMSGTDHQVSATSDIWLVNFEFQPHGPVALRARGRGASSRTPQEEESKHSAPTELQPPQNSQQQDDDELPLARVRDDALARKACLSFAYCLLNKGWMHVGHLLYREYHML